MRRSYCDENRGTQVTVTATCTDCDWQSFAHDPSGGFRRTDNVRNQVIRHARLFGHRITFEVKRTTIYESATGGEHDSGTSRRERYIRQAAQRVAANIRQEIESR